MRRVSLLVVGLLMLSTSTLAQVTSSTEGGGGGGGNFSGAGGTDIGEGGGIDIIPGQTDQTLPDQAANQILPADNSNQGVDNQTVIINNATVVPADNSTIIPADNATVIPANDTNVIPADNATTNQTDQVGNNTVVILPNDTIGNETNATAGNETAGNETSDLLGLSADDAALVFINFQNGWIQDSNSEGQFTQSGAQFQDFWRNAQSLASLGQLFNLPTFFLGNDNNTFGNWWSISQNFTNAQFFNFSAAELAFNNLDFQNALNASGKKSVILAAITADADLVLNSYLAQAQGYNVWPIIDASPYYESGDLLIALQNLGLAGIAAKSWLNLSKVLLDARPDQLNGVTQIWQQNLQQSSINFNPNDNQVIPVIPPIIPSVIPTAEPIPANNTVDANTNGRRFL